MNLIKYAMFGALVCRFSFATYQTDGFLAQIKQSFPMVDQNTIEKALSKMIPDEKVIGAYPIVSTIIKNGKALVGCEIGVAWADQSIHILENTDVEKLYSIDPYFGGIIGDIWYRYAELKLAKFGARSKLLRLTSLEAVLLFKDNELDFVYIDGDHSYAAVKADLEAWYSKVRPGGLIIGDDYDNVLPGMSNLRLNQAVDEFAKSKGLKFKLLDNPPLIYKKPIKKTYIFVKPLE